jgi:hypothetical protein
MDACPAPNTDAKPPDGADSGSSCGEETVTFSSLSIGGWYRSAFEGSSVFLYIYSFFGQRLLMISLMLFARVSDLHLRF